MPLKIITDCEQYVTTSTGVQDTPACQNLGHSSNALSWKFPEIPNLICFTKSKWCQNAENQQTVTNILSILKMVRIHEQAKFHAIPPMGSQKIPGYRNLTCFTNSKWRQNDGNQRMATRNVISSESGKNASACQISSRSKWLRLNKGQWSMYTFVLPQKVSKKPAKIENCNFSQTQNWCSVMHQRVSSWKIVWLQ